MILTPIDFSRVTARVVDETIKLAHAVDVVNSSDAAHFIV